MKLRALALGAAVTASLLAAALAPAVARAGTYSISLDTAQQTGGWTFSHDDGFSGCSLQFHAGPCADADVPSPTPLRIFAFGHAANLANAWWQWDAPGHDDDRVRLGVALLPHGRERADRLHEGPPAHRDVPGLAAAARLDRRRRDDLVDPGREPGGRHLPEDRRRPQLRRQVEQQRRDHGPDREAHRRHRPHGRCLRPAGRRQLAQRGPARAADRRCDRRRRGRRAGGDHRRRYRARLRRGRAPARTARRAHVVLPRPLGDPRSARRRHPHARCRGHRRRR